MMKERRLHIAVWIVLCWCTGLMLSSCAGKYYIYDEPNNRFFPKEPVYSLQGKLLPETARGVIDPQAIYLIEIPDDFIKTMIYLYYRFWEDGHVAYQSVVMTHFPTPADVERFYGISMGYYTIEGSTLLIELFEPNASCSTCHYLMIEAEMMNESLVIKRLWYRDQTSIRLRKMFHDESYQKIQMEELTRQPDW